MIRTLLTAALLLATSALSASTYTYQRALVVNHLLIGTADQTNLPVLVAFTSTTMKVVGSGGHVQNSSGFDIIFSTVSGCGSSPIFWEIESYSSTAGTLLFWAQVPSVSHTVDTTFYMCYGNSMISSFQSTASSVWGGYAAVYHLTNGSVLSLAGSTATPNNLTNTNTVTAGTGLVDGGASLASASTQYLTSPVGQGATNASDFTGETCFNTGNNRGSNRSILDARVGTGHAGSIVFIDTSGKLNFYINNYGPFASSSAVDDSTWHCAALAYDHVGLMLYGYLDGAQVVSQSTPFPSVGAGANVSNIGADFNPASFFNGSIDEVRMAGGTFKSAGWLYASYNTISTPSTFVTYGSETMIGASNPKGKLLLIGDFE